MARIHFKTRFQSESFRFWSEKVLTGGKVAKATLTSGRTFAARKLEFAAGNGGLR